METLVKQLNDKLIAYLEKNKSMISHNTDKLYHNKYLELKTTFNIISLEDSQRKIYSNINHNLNYVYSYNCLDYIYNIYTPFTKPYIIFINTNKN